MNRSVLVEGGIVVAGDARGTRHAPGFVLVRDGVIEQIGALEDRPEDAVDERLDARGCVVVPGLVNAHQHHWYTLFKGLGGGMLLEQWIQNLLVPTSRAVAPADLAAAARLACLEMLGTGTTTFFNHSVAEMGEEAVAATVEPVAEAGMRQVLGKELRPAGLEAAVERAEELHRRWDGAGGGRVGVGFVIEATAHWVALGTCSEELVVRGHALASRLGARISSHIAGGTMSREQGYLRFVLETGRTDVEFLHGLGVLDERWLLAHTLHPRDRDLDLIAASGATVVHTPTSESVRGGGIAPVHRMRAAGIRVALGSDGPMVDASVDMVEQMKVALLLQNQLHLDAGALTPDDVLAMATIEGARALGLEDRVGSLEPGKRADLVAFDLDHARCAVWHDPVAALVLSARGRDARHVLVDGEPLVRDKAFTRLDRDGIRAVMEEAQGRANALLHRSVVPAYQQAGERARLPAIV